MTPETKENTKATLWSAFYIYPFVEFPKVPDILRGIVLSVEGSADLYFKEAMSLDNNRWRFTVIPQAGYNISGAALLLGAKYQHPEPETGAWNFHFSVAANF